MGCSAWDTGVWNLGDVTIGSKAHFLEDRGDVASSNLLGNLRGRVPEFGAQAGNRVEGRIRGLLAPERLLDDGVVGSLKESHLVLISVVSAHGVMAFSEISRLSAASALR